MLVRISHMNTVRSYGIGHAYDVLGQLLMYTANHGDNTHVTLFMLFRGDTAFGAKRQRSSQEGDEGTARRSLARAPPPRSASPFTQRHIGRERPGETNGPTMPPNVRRDSPDAPGFLPEFPIISRPRPPTAAAQRARRVLGRWWRA